VDYCCSERKTKRGIARKPRSPHRNKENRFEISERKWRKELWEILLVCFLYICLCLLQVWICPRSIRTSGAFCWNSIGCVGVLLWSTGTWEWDVFACLKDRVSDCGAYYILSLPVPNTIVYLLQYSTHLFLLVISIHQPRVVACEERHSPL
jgi:hypothetical protein